MSLILEALKRSERERLADDGRANVAAPLRRQSRPRARSKSLLLAVTSAAVVVLGIGLAWWLMTLWAEDEQAAVPSPEVPAAVVPQPPARPPVAAVPSPAPMPVPIPTPATAGGVGSELSKRIVEPEILDGPEPPVSVPPVAVAPKPEPATTAEPPVSAVEAVSPEREDPADTNDAIGDARPPRLARLPYEMQQAVKPLRLDVHVYDEDPVRRFVMINGQSYSEGTEIKSGLLVQEINRNGVVLTWKGRAFIVGAGD